MVREVKLKMNDVELEFLQNLFLQEITEKAESITLYHEIYEEKHFDAKPIDRAVAKLRQEIAALKYVLKAIDESQEMQVV